jgi:putative tRNA adenosine deaminase-associated protein
MGTQAVTEDDIDLAMVFYREDGRWTVGALPAKNATSMEALVSALRRFPGEGGVFGAVAVADEFFVLIRETPQGRWLMISDGASTLDWSLAEEAAELIGIEVDDPEEYEPMGDLGLLNDFGIDSESIVEICQDDDAYPDEQLGNIAERLGCGNQWSAALADAR